MKHRVIQLNSTANWGSIGKIAEGIGRAAMTRGWDSTIAFGRRMNPSRSELVRFGNAADVYCHYARYRFLDGEGFGSRRPTRQLIRFLKTYRPSVIHLHNIHDHWLNYPLLFDFLSEIETPVVWTFHDCWAFTGGCYHFENAGCFKWRDNMCQHNCRYRNSARQFAARTTAYGKLGSRLHIVSVSHWVENYARQSVLSDAGANIHYIANGIDTTDIFKPQPMTKSRRIIGVSNIWPPYKGLADFIRLRKILPSDIEIVLVGLNRKQLAELPEGIFGYSRTQNALKLAELYSSASVLVNPSYNDTFPTVNLEAMACGTPVITYRTGGSPEAIDDKTGIVIDKGNITALADGIMRIINNPDRFPSESCRRRAVTLFNQEIQFDRYIDLYESIL